MSNKYAFSVFLAGALTLLVVVVAVMVCLRNRNRPLPPDIPVEPPPTEVQVRAVERKPSAAVKAVASDASRAVAMVCGFDSATAGRYEERNNALKSISRRQDLPEKDVAVLLAYLRAEDSAMRVERVAALKNDVMNLLRGQEPPPKDLPETLISIFKSNGHPSAVLDYCIQHLGAMQNDIEEKSLRHRIRATFVKAASRTSQPYAGTALYSLAEDRRASATQEAELKRLTLALCSPGVNGAARIAAIQLAGERGYMEVLPELRNTLSGARRDAVIDIACIGSLGLLGDENDIAELTRFSSDSRRSAAAESAIRKIKARAGAR